MANATIALMHPSGVSKHLWSTSNYRSQSCESMLSKAIADGQIVESGVYLVCWTNPSAMPFGRVFTLHRVSGELVIKGGVIPERVTRWPPA